MIETFCGKSADEVWQKIARRFDDPASAIQQTSRSGDTRELLHVGISISNPRDRWVVSRMPVLNVAFAIAEIVWIIAGRNDLAFLKFWNRQYADFVGDSTILHGAYGYRLRCHCGFDQLNRAFAALKGNPDSRQVVLQIWDARIDMPSEHGDAVSTDIPCNVLSMLKVRQGKLEWMQTLRSNDLFRGLPYNLIQFTYLQEIMAGWLGVEVGSYNQISDSLHIYETDLQKVRRSQPMGGTLSACDDISCSKHISDLMFSQIALRMERLMATDVQADAIRAIATWREAPAAFQNFLFILSAEVARRRKYLDAAQQLAGQCTSEALQQLWSRWWSRVENAK